MPKSKESAIAILVKKRISPLRKRYKFHKNRLNNKKPGNLVRI